MTCQREGCSNPLKGPRSRFCSGACKQLDYRNKRNNRNTPTVTPTVTVTIDDPKKAHLAVKIEQVMNASPLLKHRPVVTNTPAGLRFEHADNCPCRMCDV